MNSPEESGSDDHSAVADEVPKSTAKAFSWRSVVAVLSVGFTVYMIVVPAVWMVVNQFTSTPMSQPLTEMTIFEQIRLHAVSGVVMLLFCAMGSSIGSFLNVVIYRLPRGMRLFWPPSACPNCGHNIRGWDNMPILAWIGLRGRCRNCQVSISIRYPLIELIVAVLFVLFYYGELLSGGRNLPIREPNTYNGIVWILLYTKWDLVTIYILHTLVLTALLAWGMINYDLFRVPRSAGLAAIVFASASVMFFPHLNPTNSTIEIPLISSPVASCLAGLLAGGIGGCALQVLFRQSNTKPAVRADVSVQPAVLQLVETGPTDAALDCAPIDREAVSDELLRSFKPRDLYGTASRQPQYSTDAVFSMLLVGSVLGPLAAVIITALTMLSGLVGLARPRSWLGSLTMPITLQLFFVTTLFIVLWRQFVSFPIDG